MDSFNLDFLFPLVLSPITRLLFLQHINTVILEASTTPPDTEDPFLADCDHPVPTQERQHRAAKRPQWQQHLGHYQQ